MAWWLYQLVAHHPAQQRSVMYPNRVLWQVAQAHAQDMATQNYFSHVDLAGNGPDARVRLAGYNLLRYVDAAGVNEQTVNHVESICAGQTQVEETNDPRIASVLTGWSKSLEHIYHVMGVYPFARDQTEIGCGHAYVGASVYGHYWVFVSAPPE